MSTGSSIVVEQFFSNWNSTSLGIDIIRFADGNEWGRQLIKESSVFRGDGHANEISDSWGDDVLRGGRGDDLIRISAGNDTIIYSKGDGSDTITDNSWATTERDTLVLSDLVQADVEVSRAGNALLLRVIATGDVVQMLDFFTIKQFWDVDKRNIDVIRFADGTAWDRDAIQERAWYRGTEQADFIQAGDLDDTIEAGKGDDFLQGAAGSDRYVWRIGDGNDQISDTFTQNGDIDTLELVGVSRSQVTFSYQGDTLLINVDSGEVITVPSFLAGVTSLLTGEGDAGHGIDVIKFADGEMDRLAIFRQAGEDYLGLHPQTYGQVTAGAYDWLYFVDEFNHGGNIFGHMFLGDDDIYWAPAYGGVGGWLGPVQFSAGGNNSLIGDVGNDTMAGGAKHDILEGNAGNDVLYGDYPDESVTLYGNDILTGGSGNDALYGGGGLDLLSGGQGNDYLAGGDGKDFLDGGTGDDVFFGGKGDDILYGNTANSTGNDTYLYRSGDGNDILFESASGDASIETDTLILSDISVAGTELSRVGDDLRILIKATGETVTVVGHFLNRGAGNDSAGQGIEVLKFADAEWDRAKIHQEAWIRGTDGRDVIVTDVANAHLSDTVEGGKGDDVIVSTAQSESGGDTFVYSSGDGNDVIQESTAGNGEIDTLRFKDLNAEDVQLSRSGTDLLVKVIATGEVINIVGQFFFDAVVSPAGIERIQFADGEVWGRVRIHDEAFFRGTEGRDFIETNSRMDDTIEGGKGDDVIYSGFQSASGNDTFVYSRGDGNDYIREETWRSFSSTDIDVLLLKDLNAADVQISRNGSDLRITILAMNETITVSGQFGETSDGPGMGLEFIRFANGDEWGRETIFGIVSSASPFLAGTKNNDTITGAAISQNIYGEAGDDILDGRGGNDLLYGGLGNDTLRISVSAPGDIVTATGGVGIDTVDLSGFSAAVAVDLVSSGAEVRTTGQPDLSLGVLRDVAQLEGVENVVGSAFSDTIAGDAGNNVLTAGDGDDTLDGRSGNDVLLGEAGDDLLFGGMGEDRLEGGDGNDTLNGNVGADVLSGGAGDDILTGGTEGDIFVLGANGGHDVIADFVAGDGEGHDVLRIDRTIIANMNAFFAAASQQGDDVVVSLGAGNSVTLSGVSLAALTSANVEFRRIDNFAPTAINVQGTTVAENAAAGTVIATLAAIDSSDAGPHTFELVSDASGFFEVVGDKLVVKAGALIDFEVASKHLVEIRAVDDDGLSVTTAVEVTVTDQVEQLTAAPGGSQLMAGIGNDILVSGAGNDVLAGGAGSDEYRYFTGGGDDRIIDAGGSGDIDRLVLGPTILPSNIVVARSSLGTSDVALRISDGTTIVLQDQLLQGQGAGIEEIRFADNTVWTRADILSHLHSDILFGTSGADALSGSMGAETFYAGAGADVLRGYAGSDTYRYSSAIGTDTIVEGNDEGVDRLQLEAFNKENVQLMRSGTDLIVLAGPAGNSITIKDQFLWGDAGIEEIIFGDGSVWSRAEISARAYQFGTNGADTLVGTGDDDVLRGGLGDDVMNGGAGSDTYLYLLGDGNDIIDDGVNAAPQTDVLRFEDLDASDVEVSRTGNDLTVKVISTGETIKVAKQFASPTEFWGIEQIGFADGVAWDRAAIAENAWIRGTSSGERFDGSANGEVFDGAGGNDTLVGGAGSDTYIYRVGSGDDVIYEDASPADIDTIKLIDLNASDIQLRRSGNDLFLKILSSGDELRVMSQFSNSSGVERVLFADGTSWDRAEIVSNTWYRGSAGDDRFDGSANGEVFDGAGGNDTLVGGAGSDTYIYRVGSGGDVIYEDPSPADIDTIKLIDLNASDIQLRRSGNDLLLKILSSGDELRVMSQFSNGSGIEKVLFADGTSWDRAAIADNAWYRGSAGDDRFDGSAGGEVFDGAGGNDTLVGGTGSDTYIYRVGSGGDVVYEYPSAADIDTIKLIDLGPSDIELRRLGNDLFLTILSSGEELRVIDQFSNGNGVEKVLFADGTSWDRTEIVSNTQYRGSSGDDSISASSDADILSGGLGNDYLRGNGGNDVYLYSSGDGVDEIDDQSGSTTDIDTLRFGSLNAADLTFARQGEALSIFVSSTGHTIKVDNQFYSQTANWGIEKVEFANGSSWDLATINANAWIRGTAGNDSISGSSWSDTFKGGLGDDHFASGAGSDRYIYASGDGNDYIDDESGSTSDVDIVQFVDLNAGDLTFSRIGGNLVATVNANGQTVTFDEQFYSQTANWGIEKIEFANGSSWDLATINANAWIRGTAGNDTISGSSWNDTFKGGLGDDRFSSGAGSDRYVYASGDGNDYIDDESGSTSDIDVLQLTDLNAGDLTFSRVGVHLVATVNANGQTITFDEQFYSQTANWGIEKIEFANGTSWDLATINANAWIRGTAGNDTISGTAWNDTIHGGAGNDALSGGAGDDLFVFRAGFGQDSISDFSVGHDKLEFGDGLFADAATAFAAASAQGSDTVITIDASTTVLLQNVALANLHVDDFRVV
jgi:Ca2+-binding RTX toxin-like protein